MGKCVILYTVAILSSQSLIVHHYIFSCIALTHLPFLFVMLQITETPRYTTFHILAPLRVDSNYHMEFDDAEITDFLDLLELHRIDDVEFSQDITNKGYVRVIQLKIANELITPQFEYDLINHLVKYGPTRR